MFTLATKIFMMVMCNPSGSYCSHMVPIEGWVQTYQTVEGCRAAADHQTERFKQAGNAGYYGLCVSRNTVDWTAE